MPEPSDEEKEKFEKLEGDLDEVWRKFARETGLPRPLYFKLDENKRVIPCSIYEFDHQMEHPETRRIGRDRLGPYLVSTVFLVLDHGFGEGHLFFETMIFSEKTEKSVAFDSQWRYATYKEALEGHWAVVRLVKEGLLP
jgi:hypothetical protein